MSAETEHNEHLDLFSLKIRQKLEDHRLPVNMEGWEQIEACAGRARRARRGGEPGQNRRRAILHFSQNCEKL